MSSLAEVQAYWDRRPCNIRHSMAPLGTPEYFAEVEERKYFVEPHIPAFAEFSRWRTKNVLELGCGIGTDTISFARAGATVVAVDLSVRSLDILGQRRALCGLTKYIYPVMADIETLGPQRQYDLIYSFGVIHHTPHPARAIQRIAAIATPQTTIKIMLYHRYSWKALTLWVRYGDLRNSEAQQGCPVTHAYSRKQARELLEQNGLRVKRMFVEHIFPYRVRDYTHHRYVKVWYFRWMPRRMFRWLETRFGWHLCIEAEKAC